MAESGTGGSTSANAGQRIFLAPGAVAADAQALFGQFIILAQQAQVLIAQPGLTLSILDTLPGNQAVLATDVNKYLYQPNLAQGILGSLGAVSTIAATVSAMADDSLLPAAKALDEGVPGSASYQANLANFQKTLNQLPTMTVSQNPDDDSPLLIVQQAQSAISDLATGAIADDVALFDSDISSTSYKGSIDDLKTQIAALQQQIADLNAEIADGATSQIESALLFGLQLSSELAEAELEPGKLVLTATFALNEENEKGNSFAESMETLRGDVDTAVTQYVSLVEELAADEQQMSILLTIDGHVHTFHDSLGAAAQALTNLSDDLVKFGNGIQDLATTDSSTMPDFFQTQISQAQTAWGAVENTIGQYLTLARNLSNPAAPTPTAGGGTGSGN